MKLIIVEGATSTGKSTLAERLSKDLDVPAFKKDDYKERQFDKLGQKMTMKEMKRIERQSWIEIFRAAENAVKNNKPLIVEANFRRSHRREFLKFLSSEITAVEIFCYARGYTILKRYIDRNRSGQRHPGHHDHLWYIIVALQWPITGILNRLRPLRITDNLLMVDTDDFDTVTYKLIEKFIRDAK